MYPVNAMRNAALDGAKTRLVLLLDVDYIPSAGLHQRLSADVELQAKLDDENIAVVLPAFEVDTPALPGAWSSARARR